MNTMAMNIVSIDTFMSIDNITKLKNVYKDISDIINNTSASLYRAYTGLISKCGDADSFPNTNII